LAVSENLLTLFCWAIVNDAMSQAEVIDYLKDNFHNITQDGEISTCWELIETLNLDDETRDVFCELFREALHETILDGLSDFVDITEAFGPCEYGEYSEASRRLAEIISDKIKDLGLPEEFIDVSELTREYDIRTEMDSYFRDSYEPSDAIREIDRQIEAKSADDPIHDLFHRS
jgi:hypothetical protein